MKKLGHGVFTWDGAERRSDRYGAFNLCAEPYDDKVVTEITYDKALAKELEDKRVRILVKVVETRKSGHLGDFFLGIRPSTPEVGEEVDLGVGLFHTEPCEWDKKVTSTLLMPGNPPTREAFWFDPNKLYRLHDQTVDVFIEETGAEFTPAWTPQAQKAEGMIANGDGSFQAKKVGISNVTRIKPKVEKIGDGLFVMGSDFKAGERVEYDQEGRPTVHDRLNEDDL
jgi:hypothetical protein